MRPLHIRLKGLASRLSGLPRPHPLVLLVPVLAALAGSIALEDSASVRRDGLLKARAAYLGALTSTRSQLATLLARAATDKTLVQNLNWRLSHSVQSALSARLEPGGLDQIALLDESCREVAQVRSPGTARLPCPFESEGGFKADVFYWAQGDPFPVLAMARQIQGVAGADVYAVGAVDLDPDWLAGFPELKTWVTDLDLAVGTPSAGQPVIAAEGADLQGVLRAALFSADAWDGYLLNGDGGPFGIGPALMGPCLVAAFLLVGAALLTDRRRRRRAAAERDALIAWCKSLSPGGSVDLPGRDRRAPLRETVERFVAIAFKQKSEELRVTSRRLGAAETEIKAKDLEIRKLKHRLAELAELDSLAVQLARTTKAFLERMERFRSESQDLSDIASEGLSPCARLLTETVEGWRAGVEARSARKFFRSLAETPTAHDPQVTRLDEELGLLKTLASELDDQALATAARAKGLAETATFAVKLAGLWHGIALKTHEDKLTTSIVEPMDEAQQLILVESPHLEFHNALTAAEGEEIPALPRTVWVTALYHVYLALAELTRGTNAVIATRMRREESKILLIVQVAAKDHRPLPRRGDSEAYHLDVSRSILSPFPVTLTALPSLEGPFPVALGWDRRTVKLDGATKSHRRIDRGIGGMSLGGGA